MLDDDDVHRAPQRRRRMGCSSSKPSTDGTSETVKTPDVVGGAGDDDGGAGAVGIPQRKDADLKKLTKDATTTPYGKTNERGETKDETMQKTKKGKSSGTGAYAVLGSGDALDDATTREMYEAKTSEAAHPSARRVRERWGLNGGADWRYWTREDTVVSALKDSLDGAKIELEGDDFSLMMCAHDALETPVGVWKGDKRAPEVVVACPKVYAVDLFLIIDGITYDDGHVCAGEPDFDRAAALEAGLRACVHESEREMLRLALDSRPKGPWCTIIGERFSSGNHFVHVPLMADYLDGAILDPFSKGYAHSLMWRWAEVCQKIGAGEHQVSIQCVPVGILGKTGKDGICWRSVSDASKTDAEYLKHSGFKAFIDAVSGTYAEARSGMSASFSLTLKQSHCQGNKPERRAQEWADDWPSDEIAECYMVAMELANTGPPGEMAANMSPGSTCCHVVLPTTDGRSGIAEVMNKDGSIAFHEFHAWALFRGVDGEPEARTGSQIKFRCVRYFDEDEPGSWVAEAYGSRPCNGLLIKNKFIDEAIARDDARVKIP